MLLFIKLCQQVGEAFCNNWECGLSYFDVGRETHVLHHG